MTNQQEAQEALTDPSPDQLRAIARTARNSSGSASDDCGPLAYVLHGWRAAAIAFRAQQAALVEAQQPAAHVQNTAEIEHIAGDVSKNGTESNTAPQPAPSAAVFGLRLVPVEPTDQMVQAAHHIDLSYMPGQEGADRAAIYRAMIAAAPQPAVQQWNDLIGKETYADADGLLVWRDEVDFAIPTPQADSAQDEFISREEWVERAMRVYLIAGDTEDEARECAEYQWGELDMDDIPDPYFTAMEDIEGRGPAPQAERPPAKIVRFNPMEGGNPETALQMAAVIALRDSAQADSQPAPVLDRDRIREIFMAHGFTVKEGQTDLKQYVYDAADALLRAARAPADSVLEDAARYRFLAEHCRSTSEHWGGRWSIIINGPAPKSHDSEDDFDEAVDAARKQGANHD